MEARRRKTGDGRKPAHILFSAGLTDGQEHYVI